jgi:hypothetical protein
MDTSIKTNYRGFSTIILTFFILLSIASFCSCKEKHQEKPVAEQLDGAQQQAKQMAALLNLKSDTQEYINVKNKWLEEFIKYFEEKQQSAGEEFFTSCTEVAEYTFNIIQKYSMKSHYISLWCPILEFRNVLDNTLRNMVVFNATSNSEKELIATLNDISSIKGGCSGDFCPLIDESDVEPETKKIERLLEGIGKVLPTIKVKNEQAYVIGQEAVKVGMNAIRTLKEKTNNFDKKLLGAERANIMYEYVRSATLFTITLKVLSKNSTFVMAK